MSCNEVISPPISSFLRIPDYCPELARNKGKYFFSHSVTMGESETLLLARICASCMKTKIGPCILLHSRLARHFHFSSVLHKLCTFYKLVCFVFFVLYVIFVFRLANEIGSKFFSLFFLNRISLKISPSGEGYGDVGFTDPLQMSGLAEIFYSCCKKWLLVDRSTVWFWSRHGNI